MSPNPSLNITLFKRPDVQGKIQDAKRAVMAYVFRHLAPLEFMSTKDWANQYLVLPPDVSDRAGDFSTDLTPYTTAMLRDVDDPNVAKLVCMKSSQVGWTMGVLMPKLGKTIHREPSPIVILFPADGQAKDFSNEKLTPVIDATPVLSEKVDTSTRKSGNTINFKKFPGGFLKLRGSNAVGNVKSTAAPLLFVEEPDDANTNVNSQGNSIRLLEDRKKTYRKSKIIMGGTPSLKGLSIIEHEYKLSDQRALEVPCHECGEAHILDWDNISWLDNATVPDEILGINRPETAVYVCPFCGCAWDDWQKNQNVRRASEQDRWVKRNPASDIPGYWIWEMYSPFPGASMASMVARYLSAKHKLERGDEGDMIAFWNSVRGLPYEYQTDDALDLPALKERAQTYLEKTVPAGGLLLTSGIDVQHDRLEVYIRAWGRDEESWLVWRTKLYGNTVDKTDPVWSELDKVLSAPYPHENGVNLYISAASIDAGDGQTNDSVYHFVRPREHRKIMAIGGAARNSITAEIFKKPGQSVDTNYRNSKAAKYGLRRYVVGTHKAKNLIDGRLKLEGVGGGRMHWYEGVGDDYYEELTAEVLAPNPRNPKEKIWQLKSGKRNEALDCEVYALHASRAIKVHLMKSSQWDDLEQRIMQKDLFGFEKPKQSSNTTTPDNANNGWLNHNTGGWLG